MSWALLLMRHVSAAAPVPLHPIAAAKRSPSASASASLRTDVKHRPLSMIALLNSPWLDGATR